MLQATKLTTPYDTQLRPSCQTDAQFASLCKAGAELGVRRAAEARHGKSRSRMTATFLSKHSDTALEVSKIKATQFRGLSVNVANALRLAPQYASLLGTVMHEFLRFS